MAVTTKHRLLEVVLAGALFGLAGDLCCLAIMRHSIAWDLAVVQQFALATLAGSLAGSLAWWAGRGGADAPAWRVTLIGLAAVFASYPAWVFLMGLRVGVVYNPAVLVVYSAPLLLISGKFTLPAGLATAFLVRSLVSRCRRPGPISTPAQADVAPPRGGPRFLQDQVWAGHADGARLDPAAESRANTR